MNRRIASLAALALGLLCSSVRAADDPKAVAPGGGPAEVADICYAPPDLGRLAVGLPRTRAALRAGRPLKIVTLGSSSTAGAGASAPRFSYPARLAVELAQRLPDAKLDIVNRGINGEDALENVRRLDRDVLDARPDLVIWQIGTNAVMRGVDYDDYERIVQDGIDRMRAQGIEILLMDLQYSPRVIEVPDHRKMLDAIDAIGARDHLPVFHRYAVMAYWSAQMQARYASMISSDGLHLDDASYGCLAERLADAIVGDDPVPGSRRTNLPAVMKDTGDHPPE